MKKAKKEPKYGETFTGDLEFLSNSFPSTFIYKGIKYKTVAHAYYSLKAKHESDAKKIRESIDVHDAISLGKKCESHSTWRDTCKSLMKELLVQKFDNPFLRPRLIATNELKLGNGKNFVGELLMEIRNSIKET